MRAGAADAAELRALEAKLRQAQVARDWITFASLLSENLTFTHVDGRVEGNQAYLAGQVKSAALARSERENLCVNVHDNVAVMTGRRINTVDGSLRQYAVMQIWLKTDQVWRLLAQQTGRLG